MYLDANGLIVQENGDGGDTAGREGDFWFAVANRKDTHRQISFDQVITLLQVSPGVFVRNPVHYNDPKDFSRDQTMPLILAMGEMGYYANLRRLFWNQFKNFGRYPNGDIAGPEDLGYYIRAFQIWQLYPVLIVGDLQMFVNTLIRLYKGRDTNDVSDDINHTLSLLQAQYVLPTPISWLARKLYKHIKGGVQSRWDWYFRPETGANNFNDLYHDLISSM